MSFATMQKNDKEGSNRLLAAGCSKVRFGPEVTGWCCQTNVNQYQFPKNRNLLGCTEGMPLDQSSGTVQLEI